MTTNTLNAATSAYSEIMTEIKIRIQWIEYAANGRTGMDPLMVREFGYLQLRMSCELVALGCLVAHGDIQATKTNKFQSAFAADSILKGLENLNPDFFPNPLVQIPVGPGCHHFQQRPNEDYTTKDELLDLYARRCGTILHKGNLKNLMKPQPPVQKNFPELLVPAQRLMNLLSVHRIALQSNTRQFMCWLSDAQKGGAVSVAVAEQR